MTFTYARVGLELWGSQSIGECTQRQLENIKSKRRVSFFFVISVIKLYSFSTESLAKRQSSFVYNKKKTFELKSLEHNQFQFR
jgi:hypothetical protein